MNRVLTAAANFVTFSCGRCDKNPILLPNIKVQTASSPNKLTIFWKFSTTFVVGSRFTRNRFIKSSQMQFSSGKKDWRTRGLVICEVSLVRKWCHVSPCLQWKENFCKEKRIYLGIYEFTNSLVIPVEAYRSGRIFR